MAEIVILAVLVTFVVGAVLLAHNDGAHGEREAEDWNEDDGHHPTPS